MTDKRKMDRKPGYPLMLGANRVSDGYNFAVEAPENAEVSLILYHRHAKIPTTEIALDGEYRTGRIFSVCIRNFLPEEYEYNFQINGRIVQDPCAYRICGRDTFGAPRDEDAHKIRCGFLPEKPLDWEGDAGVDYPYRDMILYKIHVRGFTKLSKDVKGKKGTFLALTQRIPYWKELGVNTVELMPAYEFADVPQVAEPSGMVADRRPHSPVNYWGYVSGYYFAPKAAYCAGKNPDLEFAAMIKAFHQAGISCILEFYFPADVNPFICLRALQFWKRYYHVDGFHLTGEGVPLDLILKDGVLADTKIMAQGYDMGRLPKEYRTENRRFAEYNPGFQTDLRRFLKSDEEMVPAAAWRIRRNPENYGVINYMACQDGFTLRDLVSYNEKHNEENGEGGRDGSSYNYSWNCGVEGTCRKQAVRRLRLRQIKNAFAMMLLSQGTPMLYGGDEALNSQGGNNNAYCQDNVVGWTDWSGLKKQPEIFRFVKKLIAFRKNHPILHMEREMMETDYENKGFPEVSLHGERAWFCNSENTSRMLGIMYCGAYAGKADGTPDDNLYVAYNFYWENRKFALPNQRGGLVWKKVLDTGIADGDSFCEDAPEEYTKSVEVTPRSVVVLIGTKPAEKQESNAESGVPEISEMPESREISEVPESRGKADAEVPRNAAESEHMEIHEINGKEVTGYAPLASL